VRTESAERGSRVFGLGCRLGGRFTTGRRLTIAGLAAAALLAGLTIVLAVTGGGPARPHASPGRYGGLPGWLPKSTIPVGRIVVASAAHPSLAVEGDTVSVHLAHGQALVTAVGPAVPEEGQFPLPVTTACTFTVSFARASGLVPLSSAAFTILDEFSHLHHLQVTAQREGSLPAAVASGRTVTVTMKAVLPTGNGQLRWAPGGGKPIVSWDFDVEID